MPFAGPKRFHPPPAPLASLPPLDAVILSHDHYDHLDRPTIRALARTRVPFVTSLGVGAHLEKWGIPPERITELDWWALAAYAMLGSGAFLPIHWGTFNLAMHPWDEPAETVFRRAPSLGVSLVTPRLGEPVEPSRAETPQAWWRSVSSNGGAESVDEADARESEAPVEWMPD